MAMNDLPFAVLPAEHVGDAQHVLLDGATVDRKPGTLEADRAGQVTAEPGGHEVQAVVADAGEPRREPAEAGLTSSHPLLHGPHAPDRVTGSWSDHMARRGSGSPLCRASSASTKRVRVVLRKSSSSLMACSLALVRATVATSALPAGR